MIASLKAKAIGLMVAALALLSAFLYWQHVTTQRDAYQAEAERQRDRAEILQEHQQWQRQQIETLSSAMAERDRTLSALRDDISASTSALQSLGESDAEARDWLDGDRPGVITDWVRELQRSGTDDVRLPDSTPASNE
jgi:septal ring factor EnvC (AmiA/AmiB activator)